jgi:hypothetical protein
LGWRKLIGLLQLYRLHPLPSEEYPTDATSVLGEKERGIRILYVINIINAMILNNFLS